LLLFGSRDPVNCSVRIQVCATGEGKKTLCIFSSIHYSLCPGISDLQPRQCTCQINDLDASAVSTRNGALRGLIVNTVTERFGKADASLIAPITNKPFSSCPTCTASAMML